MKEYSYSAADNSLLTPVLYKFFVYPLVKVLPYGLPANFITIIANSLVVLAFCLVYANYRSGTDKFMWLIPLLVLAYIIGDCSDGIQARRTKTGSPLGEYFDHFLDSFVTGLLTGMILCAFRITNPVLIFCLYQFLYLGQIGTFWERYGAGVMRFAKLSTSEGSLAIALMVFLSSFTFMKKAFLTKVICGLSIPEIIITSAFLGAFFCGVLAIVRTNKNSFRLLLHIFLACFMGAALTKALQTDILPITLIITFYHALFIESLLAATALKTTEAFPDLVAPASCILFFLFKEYLNIIAAAQILYLLLRLIIRFIIFFNQHKELWLWKNPPKKSTYSITKVVE